ncbi:hypothetical protein PN36_08250 [Candidatus Thiomargarita nelsonii]|uniref:Glycosyl transferase family 8 n=1 Tax=Candidatus Thiomargarita nelsonii TaxID=1003181 RepID=A0A0A6RRK3_9GAMM|nr:hypothetical protein PN36_08250 [Candidatus Thiomargarita nelsonii]
MEAYITLVTNDNYIPGVIALAKSLRYVNATRSLIVCYTASVTQIQAISNLGIEIIEVSPPSLSEDFLTRHQTQNIHKNNFSGVKPNFHNTLENWTKLTIWTFEQYHKLVYLDADTIAFQNPDRLFDFPAFGAAPNLYTSIEDLNRMNSGVLVIQPDTRVYDKMIGFLNQTQSFYRRTDQTFLQAYFEDWHVLPYTYNTLQYVYLNLPQLWDWKTIKIIHYQYEKPWDDKNEKKNVLKEVIQVWRYLYENASIPSSFLASLNNPSG